MEYLKKYKHYKVFLFVCAFLFCLLLFISSPAFYVKDVNISGNQRTSSESIKIICNLNDPTNIFWFYSSRYKKMLEKDNYIKNVTFKRDYLNKSLNVLVEEARLSGYVQYLKGTYLYIDDRGVVLQVASSYDEKLPVVVGLNFTEFTLGEPLKIDDERKFNAVVNIAQLINKYQIEGDVLKVDLNDLENIKFYISNVEVKIGNTKNIDEKVRWLVAIMNNYPDFKTARATLDLSDENVQATLKYLD